MFIKIILLASLAAVSMAQRMEDCNAGYKACFASAKGHYQNTGDARGANYCNKVFKKCQEDAVQQAEEDAKKSGGRVKVIRRPATNNQASDDDNDVDSGSDKDSEITDNCLDAHNKLRAKHGVPALKAPSSALRKYAEERGKELARTDKFAHPSNSPYGENLFMGAGKDFTCEDAVNNWYNEIKDYDFKNPGFKSGIGHFTQVVWKDTKEVACVKSKSSKTGYSYIVCDYNPPGNFMGRFPQNVAAPQ